MNKSPNGYRSHVLAALAGAIGSAAIILLFTRMIPRMMVRIAPLMMEQMMVEFEGEGCDPGTMCRDMIAGSLVSEPAA